MQPSYLVGNLPSFLVILGFIYFLTLAYRVHKNPLSSLPGPQITKWTGFILKCSTVLGQRPRYVHSLHQRYGPIVRVSPSEIHVADIPSAREIHRIGSAYHKSPWYRLLNRKDGESIFSTTDPEFHRTHRRLLSSPLSDTNLRTVMEPLVRGKVQLAMRRMGEEMRSRAVVDIYKWLFFMTTDIIGELSFGDSFRMLELGKKNQYITDLETVAAVGGIRATFPSTVSLASVLPLSIFKEVVESTDRMISYAVDSVNRYKTHLEQNPASANPTLFTKLYHASQLHKDKEGERECLSDQEICNDAQSFIIAGSDTTAATLTYLIWSVCREEAIQAALVAELKGALAGPGAAHTEIITDTQLRDLPYMNRVITEALRLYPAVPSALPRVVPEKGATMAGYWIPGGATVSTQLYTLHRDPEVFENPERFDPSRWEEPSKNMKDAFMPFGAGSRNCIGLHLARMELRLATAYFFHAFPTARVSTRENMSDSDMDQTLYFLMSPKGKRCLLEV
ncbi:hypothetical protein AOCH_004422 [Aspergillus ochraceoroseus]|uniref:Cytochrome P450 n=1 Tax=Aspergillus ochraceoroseus TaxID=138278 RepID=A0A0F8X0C8_9EURO|nr:hypothetical protein AOCH_004422 [Aspergillus ochraceoroseus]